MIFQDKFPETAGRLKAADRDSVSMRVASLFKDNLKQLQIDADLSSQLEGIYIPLASVLAAKAKEKQRELPLIVGVNGAQGSGKSTLCTLLETILQQGFGLKTISISIDDLYFPQAQRKHLGATVHPLLATRGVPGTHDIELASHLFDQLSTREPGQRIAVPVFDKAVDDRKPKAEWREAITPFDLILFEGWCVGAKAQPESALPHPVNNLETDEDPDGLWRSYANQRLAEDYAALFARLDLLIMLLVPGMDSVLEWRSLQEQKLALQQGGTGATHIMSHRELHRFIMHYERLTNHMLREMPAQADIVLRLNRAHLVDGVGVNAGAL